MTLATPTLAYTPSEAKRWARDSIKGHTNAMLTPFRQDFSLDEDGLRRNIGLLINDTKLDGLMVGGNTAEAWNMTNGEWERYHEIVSEEAAGRVFVVMVVVDPSPIRALAKVEQARAWGFDAAELMTPVFQVTSDDEIVDYVRYIAERSPMALFLYNTPVARRVLSHGLIGRLAEIETVVGIKHAVMNYGDTLKLRREYGDCLLVLEPSERFRAQDLARFGPLPQFGTAEKMLYGRRRSTILEYERAALDGDIGTAMRVSATLDPVRDLLEDLLVWNLVNRGTYTLAGLKYWAQLLGLAGGPVRPPFTAYPTDQERAHIEEVLSANGVL
ncbi:MAG: dihydrodipicolinate synthase family protein [Candidatus Limnocylindrales bacterium]